MKIKTIILLLAIASIAASWGWEQTNTWGVIKPKRVIAKFVTPGWKGVRGEGGLITLSSNNVVVQLRFEHE